MKYYNFKSAFKHKLAHLKCQGQKLEVFNKTEQWIEANLDELFAQYKANEKYGNSLNLSV